MTAKLANPKPRQCITINPAKAALTAQAARIGTIFAGGINPFSALAKPTKPEPSMSKPAKPVTPKPEASNSLDLTITNDPLPAKRAAPLYKYHPVFDQLAFGQSVRVPSANIGKVAGAMRKWIEMKGKQAHIKSTPSYCDDKGYGRVWLLEGASLMPSRKKTS